MNLDKETLSILQHIYRQKIITYGELKDFYPNKSMFEFICVLADEKAIDYESVQGRARNGQIGLFIQDESKISCTAFGKKYVEDYLERKRERRINAIRYAVNTAISVSALIISLIALLSQLGLLRLPRLTLPY